MRFFILLLIVFVYAPSSLVYGAPRVGVMAELTGPFAPLGEDCGRGFQVAISANPSFASGDVVFSDNQGMARAGLEEFRRMVEIENVVAVVTTRSPVGMAINPISRKNEVPLVGVLGHPDFTKQNGYAIRAFPSAELEGQVLAANAIKRGVRRVSFLTAQDDYFNALQESFEEYFRKHGGSVGCKEEVLPDMLDFLGLANKLKNCRADALVINITPAQSGLFLSKYRTIDSERVIFSNFLIGSPDSLSRAGKGADNVVFVEVDFNQPAFLKRLAELTHATHSSSVGYSCYVALTSVLQNLQGCNSKSECSTRLLSAKQVRLLDGEVGIMNREIQIPVVLRELKKGRVVNASNL